MPTSPSRIAVAFAILAGALLAPISSFAQVTTPATPSATFPQRTLKFVVPSPPGTSLDLLPRLLGKKLSESSGRPVIVENRPGAAGHVGAEAVARAEPDGHTLLATAPGTLVLSPWLDVKLGFDAAAFVPVTVLVKVPTVLVVNAKLPVNSFAEWIAYAKANPTAMAYGSPGTGSTAHLAQEELMRALGVRLLHVPYQGMGPAINDLLAGHIQTMFAATGTVLPHIDDGKLRAIAITGGDRLARLPGVPVITETVPGYNHIEWFAIVAPPRTPAPVVEAVWQALAAALREPEVQAWLQPTALELVANSPAQAAAFIEAERERWRAIVEARRSRGEQTKP
jgi:tripartite-type tricarboxylate transporter receptor subunit TctC